MTKNKVLKKINKKINIMIAIIISSFIVFILSSINSSYKAGKNEANVYIILNQIQQIKLARFHYKETTEKDLVSISDLFKEGFFIEIPKYKGSEWGDLDAVKEGTYHLTSSVSKEVCQNINNKEINKYDYLKCDLNTNIPYFY